MEIEKLNYKNIQHLIPLVVALWPDCIYEEEYPQYEKRMNLENEICYLMRESNAYIAFIHTVTRNEFVEGADRLPIANIEGLYVKPEFRKKGIATRLVVEIEKWARQNELAQIASDTETSNEISIDFQKRMDSMK